MMESLFEATQTMNQVAALAEQSNISAGEATEVTHNALGTVTDTVRDMESIRETIAETEKRWTSADHPVVADTSLAGEYGFRPKPALIGPFTWLALGKAGRDVRKWDRLEEIAAAYVKILLYFFRFFGCLPSCVPSTQQF